MSMSKDKKNSKLFSVIKKNAPILYLIIFVAIGCMFVPNFGKRQIFLRIF